MYPKILSIYGPFEINGYNLAIILGISLFIYLVNKHPLRPRYFTTASLINLCIEAALAGIIGGRILHVVSSLPDYPTLLSFISIWDGGLSVLGGLIGVLSYILWYCHTHALPVLDLTDMAALYAPLLQGIGRIGCFLVGCCYGAPTQGVLSITYTNPQVYAPLGIALHPAQLYSAFLYFALFGILYLLKERAQTMVPGMLTMWYLIGMSLERFMVDFVRGDRITTIGPLSFYQWIALAIFITAVSVIGLLHQRRPRESV